MKEIGQSASFKNFSERNRIYVDKTEQIYSLLKFDRVFFSRPRRFGKSLVLDTIAPYLKKGWNHILKIHGYMINGQKKNIPC